MVSWQDAHLLVTIVGVGALRQVALIIIGILNQPPCGVGELQQIAGTVMLRRPPKLPHLWPPKLLHLAGVS